MFIHEPGDLLGFLNGDKPILGNHLHLFSDKKKAGTALKVGK